MRKQYADVYPESIRRIIRPREVDLGGFMVRRALPTMGIDAVGPWVFFDHIGPAGFPPGKGVDVLPHPHINLATVTYLFEGEIVHRDSIGSVQTITPGAVNLMVAAKGIVHSERTGPELRARGHRMHGLQLWLGLPEEHEEADPLFIHYPGEALPKTDWNGTAVRVVIGSAFGLRSPVKTYSSTLYAEAVVPEGADFGLPEDMEDGSADGEAAEELAAYVVSGRLRIRDFALPTRSMIVFARLGGALYLSADEDSRIALIGGKPLGKRFMWWNFVSSRRERIEKAKGDWKEGRFAGVPGETEFYPLPERDAFSEKKR